MNIDEPGADQPVGRVDDPGRRGVFRDRAERDNTITLDSHAPGAKLSRLVEVVAVPDEQIEMHGARSRLLTASRDAGWRCIP